MMGEPLIINAATTGMVPRKKDNPHVPETPEEIASDVEKCRRAGASIVHFHARDANGEPTYRKEVFAEAIRLSLHRSSDIIVCVSLSGRNFKEYEQRAEALDLDGAVKPEMASLTLGSMNFPREASVNDPRMIGRLADRMRERGIVPELEVFDVGMIDYMNYLIQREVLREPFYVNILLGSLGTLSATPFNLAACVEKLPAGATWAACGIGRFQFPMNCQAIAMGGNVRVGLEDNLFYDVEKTRPADNPGLVARLARVAAAMERPISAPDEARRRIGLPVPERLRAGSAAVDR